MVRRIPTILTIAVLVLFGWGLRTAEAKYQYGRSTGSGQPTGFFFFGEGVWTNPRNVDAVVATTESVEDFGGGVNTLTEILPDWEDEVAWRFGGGYSWASGNKLVVSYWSFDADQSAAGSGPLGGITHFAVGPPIRTGGGFVGNQGSPGSYGLTTTIEASTADVAFGRPHELTEGFKLEWSLGLRWANYEETTEGFYDEAAIGSPDLGRNTYFASKSNEGDMIGVRAAVHGGYRFAKAFSLDAGVGVSFLDGELTASSGLTPTGLDNSITTPSSYIEINDDGRSGNIWDVDVTVSWYAVGEAVRLWVGWEQQIWDDIPADLVRNFPGTTAPLRERDSVTFSGYKLGVFVRF